MAIARARGTERVARILAALPPGRILAGTGAGWLVVGPSGAFVVLPDPSGGNGAGRRAGALAEATRAALAEHLSWVPFVDAVVVTDRDGSCGPGATAVPVDLLPEVLVEGPTVIDDPTVRRVGELVAAGLLPPWHPVGGTGAKIDLCTPAPDAAPTG
jgi:hypothetical protein